MRINPAFKVAKIVEITGNRDARDWRDVEGRILVNDSRPTTYLKFVLFVLRKSLSASLKAAFGIAGTSALR
jgi:hypothetical protein